MKFSFGLKAEYLWTERPSFMKEEEWHAFIRKLIMVETRILNFNDHIKRLEEECKDNENQNIFLDKKQNFIDDIASFFSDFSLMLEYLSDEKFEKDTFEHENLKSRDPFKVIITEKDFKKLNKKDF